MKNVSLNRWIAEEKDAVYSRRTETSRQFALFDFRGQRASWVTQIFDSLHMSVNDGLQGLC